MGHDCLAALDDAVQLCSSLGHELVEARLPGLTPDVAAAVGLIFNAASAWIVRYWIRRLRRPPGGDELEPLTRAYWEMGENASASDYLLAIEDCQVFARGVAQFLTGVDVWLTPRMSSPPALIGEITSTAQEPLRAFERGGPTVAYAGVVANVTGNPAMSVPLWWNTSGLPVGVHFLGRYGDEATLFRLASQLESVRPWSARTPSVSAGTTPPGTAQKPDRSVR